MSGKLYWSFLVCKDCFENWYKKQLHLKHLRYDHLKWTDQETAACTVLPKTVLHTSMNTAERSHKLDSNTGITANCSTFSLTGHQNRQTSYCSMFQLTGQQRTAFNVLRYCIEQHGLLLKHATPCLQSSFLLLLLLLNCSQNALVCRHHLVYWMIILYQNTGSVCIILRIFFRCS